MRRERDRPTRPPGGTRAGWRQAVEHAYEHDEHLWGLEWRFVTAALVLLPVGAVLVAATLVHMPLYRWVTQEDGPIEWSQFAFDLAAFAGSSIVAVVLYRRGRRVAALLWAVFALSQLFIAGEEISWGQRVFDTTTPDELERLNHQSETNVHNIGPMQDSINAVFMLVGAYGSIGVVANRRWWRPRRRPDWFDLFAPPNALFTLFTLFLLVLGYKLARIAVFQSPRFVVVKFGEYIELCTAVALAAFAWLTLRRLRTSEA